MKYIPIVVIGVVGTLVALAVLTEEGSDALRDAYNRYKWGSYWWGYGGGGAAECLKRIATAQQDYYTHDRDGDGLQDYWRGDIAGLYTILPRGTSDPVKLIELSIAGADANPVTPIEKHTTRAAKAGYWYRALLHADERTLDPNRFAACAFPDRYEYGSRWTYLIDETGVVYRKKLRDPPSLSSFPADPARDGWQRVD